MIFLRIGFLTFLSLMTLVVNAATIPTQESGNYSAFCKEEWSKRGILDQQMYNYCINFDYLWKWWKKVNYKLFQGQDVINVIN